MSGFGEVSAALGLFSVAVDLADSGKRLYRFCKDVKNAEEDLQDVVNRLMLLSSILTQIDAWLKTVTGDAASIGLVTLQSARKNSQTVARDAIEIVAKLEANCKAGKKWASIKAALKKDAIEQCQLKIDRANGDLNLAFNALTFVRNMQLESVSLLLLSGTSSSGQAHLSQTQSTFISETIPKQSVLESRADDTDSAIESACQTGRERQQSSRDLYKQKRPAKLAFPIWMSTYIVDIYMTRSSFGWGIEVGLKCRRVVPRDCPFFIACKLGDLAGVQRLLNSGLASIDDEDPHGVTALGAATTYGDGSDALRAQTGAMSVTKYLLENGLHRIHARVESWDLFHQLLQFPTRFGIGSNSSQSFSKELSRYIWANDLVDPSSGMQHVEPQFHIYLWADPTTAGRSVMLSSTQYLPYMSTQQRIDYLEHFMDSPGIFTDPADLTNWIGLETFEQIWSADLSSKDLVFRILVQMIAISRYQGKSEGTIELLHKLLHGGCVSEALYNSNNVQSSWQGSMATFDLYIRTCLNISLSWNYNNFLNSLRRLPTTADMIEVLVRSLMFFAIELQYLGLDLASVGQALIDHQFASGSSHWRMPLWYRPSIRLERWKTFCFVLLGYGPQPEDWHGSIVECDLRQSWRYAGEFWDMVDHPERALPGSWIDESYYHYCDIHKPFGPVLCTCS